MRQADQQRALRLIGQLLALDRDLIIRIRGADVSVEKLDGDRVEDDISTEIRNEDV